MKTRAQRRHANKRLYSRFGLFPSDHDHIVRMIQEGQAEFIHRESNRVSVFRVVINGTPIKAIYDKTRKQLATVLYDHWETY